MLGIIILYGLGKAFYDLAVLHNKNKWGITILSIISYYVFSFIAGIILALLFGLAENPDAISDTMLGFLALPIALVFCFFLYVFLKNRWEAMPKKIDTNLLDDDLIA